MPSHKVSLLLADVDGTLVTKEKVLTERAIAAVRKLKAAGIRFAITSGRPPKGSAMLIDPLEIAEPIAGFNGGLFTRPDLGIIEARTLPREVAEKAIELIRAHKLDAWVYSGEDWLVPERDGPHVAREEWTVKFPPKVTDDFGAALDHAVKIVGVSDDLDAVKQCEADVQAALGDSASAARSQPYYLDVTHPQANKGAVVETLSEMLGIPTDEIATIGDQPNDVLMFRKGGMSIAMGNASDEVKSKATHVTFSSEEEGFARAIERFILEEDGE
jgi:Cof subfamily protein (haloacid dehalogenase superfamily)